MVDPKPLLLPDEEASNGYPEPLLLPVEEASNS